MSSRLPTTVAYSAIMAWGHLPSADNFRTKRKAIHITAGLRYQDESRYKFKDLRILTLPCKYIFQRLLYTYNNINSFSRVNSNRDYPTQSNINLQSNFNHFTRSHNMRFWWIKFYNLLTERIRLKNKNRL